MPFIFFIMTSERREIDRSETCLKLDLLELFSPIGRRVSIWVAEAITTRRPRRPLHQPRPLVDQII